MKRPLGIVALLYGSGVLLGDHLQPPLIVLFALSLGLVVAAALLPRTRATLLWPLLILSGWTRYVADTGAVSPYDLRNLLGDTPTLATVRGRLSDTPAARLSALPDPAIQPERSTLARLQVSSLQRGTQLRPAAGEVVVSTPGVLGPEFHAGQLVEISGVMAPPPGAVADGLFDYREYLLRQGIHYRLKAQSSNDWRLLSPTAGARPLKDRFLEWAKAVLGRGLPHEDESLRLEWALSLGDKTVLSEEVAEPFVRASTFHIFAVDGLRMAILFGVLLSIARAVRLPRAGCGILVIPLIWWYTEMTGSPASAVRAAIMLTILIVGWCLKRPGELVNSLFAAALVLLIWDPQQIFQAGFQLSFLVVLSMVLVMPVLERLCQHLVRPDPLHVPQPAARWRRIAGPPARYVLEVFLTSIAAWLGSIPLAAYYFHILTPISGPANLVAVPLCALVLISNFSSLLVAGWWPAGSELFNHSGWFLMECIRATSRWFSGWPGAYFYVAPPAPGSIALYYLVLVGAFSGWLFKPPRRAVKLAVLAVLALAWAWQWQREHAAARLTILPLNGGSAVFADAPGAREDLLVDCGTANAVERVVKPFLRAQGMNRLPCLLLTHGELRQVGGANLLAEALPIGQTAIGCARFRSRAYRDIVDHFRHCPNGVRTLDPGDLLNGWTVLHPDKTDRVGQADDGAVVLWRNIYGTRILLLSDLSRAGQNTLLARHPWVEADIVVGGLPQDGEPMSDELLDAVHPRMVIIADSEYPSGRRAGAALKERLGRRAVHVFYTREQGAVRIILRPAHWETRTMAGRRIVE